MLNNCNYNKAKLVHEISKLIGFIDRHGIKDADSEKHSVCAEELKHLKGDLENHLGKLSKEVELVAKEGNLA